MVQLTNTPIFAIFREVFVNSQMSVKFQNSEMGFFGRKTTEINEISVNITLSMHKAVV